MLDRRFIIDLRVPSTLADDDEALQFFAEGMWREMLRRAGGVPAEEPMVRAILGNDHTPSEAGLITFVDVHIIGYARPAIEVQFQADTSIFTTSIEQLINSLVGAEMNVRVQLPRSFEGNMSGPLHPGTIQAIDGDGDDVDVWDDDDDDEPYWDYEPGWGDAMQWSHEPGKKAL